MHISKTHITADDIRRKRAADHAAAKKAAERRAEYAKKVAANANAETSENASDDATGNASRGIAANHLPDASHSNQQDDQGTPAFDKGSEPAAAPAEPSSDAREDDSASDKTETKTQTSPDKVKREGSSQPRFSLPFLKGGKGKDKDKDVDEPAINPEIHRHDFDVSEIPDTITEDDIESIRQKRAAARSRKRATVADIEDSFGDDMFRTIDVGTSDELRRNEATQRPKAKNHQATAEGAAASGTAATSDTSDASGHSADSVKERYHHYHSDGTNATPAQTPVTRIFEDAPTEDARHAAREEARSKEELFEALRAAGVDEDYYVALAPEITAKLTAKGKDGSKGRRPNMDDVKEAMAEAMMESATGERRAMRKTAKKLRKQLKRSRKKAKKSGEKAAPAELQMETMSREAARSQQVSSIYGAKTKKELKAERKRTRRARTPKIFGVPVWQWLMLIIGLAFLSYPIIADRISAWQADQAITSYTDTITQYDPAEINRMLDEAHAYNDRLSGTPNDYQGTIPDANNLISHEGLPFGWVEFPQLAEKLPLYHGTSNDALQAGVGHLEGSSFPVGGTSTHAVLTGHSGMPGNRMFDDIDRLVIGDVFMIHVLNVDLAYRVISVEVVWPDQTESLAIQPGRDLVTLITCTPYGVNDHRLLVHAERTDYSEALELPSNNMALFFNQRTMPFIIAIVFMIIFFFGISLRRKLRYPLELGVDTAWNGLSDYTDDKRRYVGERRV